MQHFEIQKELMKETVEPHQPLRLAINWNLAVETSFKFLTVNLTYN